MTLVRDSFSTISASYDSPQPQRIRVPSAPAPRHTEIILCPRLHAVSPTLHSGRFRPKLCSDRMTDSSWPSAFSCPECLGFTGLASAVQSHRPGKILVDAKCRRCAHEWQLERDIPTYAIRLKEDRRQQPRGRIAIVTSTDRDSARSSVPQGDPAGARRPKTLM
jgi:hypothetical protein